MILKEVRAGKTGLAYKPKGLTSSLAPTQNIARHCGCTVVFPVLGCKMVGTGRSLGYCSFRLLGEPAQ